MSPRDGDAASNAATVSGGVFVNFGILRPGILLILPERRDVSTPRELAAKREHRRVRREDDELAARGNAADGAIDRAAPRVDDLDAVGRGMSGGRAGATAASALYAL